MWSHITQETVDAIYKELNELNARLKRLEEQRLPSGELIDRLESLELWRGKIHSMITTTDKRGNEKLSKFGKFAIGDSVH